MWPSGGFQSRKSSAVTVHGLHAAGPVAAGLESAGQAGKSIASTLSAFAPGSSHIDYPTAAATAAAVDLTPLLNGIVLTISLQSGHLPRSPRRPRGFECCTPVVC